MKIKIFNQICTKCIFPPFGGGLRWGFFLFVLIPLFCFQTRANDFGAEKFVFTTAGKPDYFSLTNNKIPIQIIADDKDFPGVLRAVNDLKNDFQKVTGQLPATSGNTAIIAGTVGKSSAIDRLLQQGKIAKSELSGKREKYIITVIDKPSAGIDRALVIAGSDRRGTIYGIYELSQQIGVSPWYWWADVPVARRENLYVKPGVYTEGEPAVAYRGIFINDEAPAFQGWCQAVFGGVNSKMYVHIFELILRLKGNFLWPAMWGNAFYDDDPASGALADEMGIVIGTSHHEPLGRAHDEWRRYGKGDWNYEKNPEVLREFWRESVARMKDFEVVATVGMRGDGDEPMSREADIALLEKIIRDQREIIRNTTGKNAEETPQVWALYKEVQDYYDRGMRVPDDVTLLLCDDNWGNVRKLPDINAPMRKGGYGMYYHFDYVGAPRNYKWINVSQIQRVWEQMNISYLHGVRQLWVVNVGDLKPMEFPISFFLNMAWNPDRFNSGNLLQYTEDWCVRQFGEEYAHDAARMINLYTKYNSRVTPEMLDDKKYSLDNYDEFKTAVNDYKELALDALRLYNRMPPEYRDAFDQLVLFPINAVCNLYEMYYALAMNKRYVARYDLRANAFADKVKECFQRDTLLTIHYNSNISNGKWAHQMDQVRIGYNNWQQPSRSLMPKVEYVYREIPKEKRFIEKDGYISMEANHFSRSQGTNRIQWKVIDDLGRTSSSVTTFPQNAYPQANENIYLEYDLQTVSSGEAEITVFLSPTLNFNANKGLRYALSFDGGKEEIINFNGHYDGSLGKWQGERIIQSVTKMSVAGVGNRTLRVRALDPGIVFQKIIINFGGLKPSYLGAPESEYVAGNKRFPDFPPEGLSVRVDHDQMMTQLELEYPALPENTNPNPDGKYFTARSTYGLWTNYVQAWEPNGDYYTGAMFYKPLALHDLTGLNANSWSARREKIKDEVQKIYGYVPQEASRLKIEWTQSEPHEMQEVINRNGQRTPTIPFRQYEITGKIDVSGYPEIRNAPLLSGVLRVPANIPAGQKIPVVVHFSWGFGRWIMADEELWNAMAPEGIGVLYFNPVALQPDNGEELTNYLIGLVNRGNWRNPSDWGTLVAWSWGVSRFIDFFENDHSLVDVSKIALTGHSRYGKATLAAMAYDTRIAISFPSSAGAMGTSQNRRHWGQDLENCIWETEYHWLAGNAMIYAGLDESSKDGYLPRKVLQMPVDAESLIALCAPRPIFIGSGDSEAGEAWTDPYGQYLAALAATPVYELLGKKGIVMDDIMEYNEQKIPMPILDKAYLTGDIGYRQHRGGHEAGPNYPAFKEFIMKYW